MVEHPPICPEPFKYGRSFGVDKFGHRPTSIDECKYGDELTLDCGGDSWDCMRFNCESGYARRLAAGYQMFMWGERLQRWTKISERCQTRWRAGRKYHYSLWDVAAMEVTACKQNLADWFKWGLES